jgi:predicted XRE-type DNA-binding protein
MKKKTTKRKPISSKRSAEPKSIFEELGFDRAEAAALERKSALYSKVVAMAQERDVTQKELASLLGITQPHVSQLLSGKISRFSFEKLIEFAERLGADVKIVVRKKAS